jgi:hypothetical protein
MSTGIQRARAPESSVAERDSDSPRELAFAGLMQPRHHAYVARQGGCVSEASRIAGLADDACCGGRSDTLDGGEKLPDLVRIKLSFDVALQIACPLPEGNDVLASISNPQLVRIVVMLAD